MAMRRKRSSDRSGRRPLRSPGRPTVARREERVRFWARIAGGESSEALEFPQFSGQVGTEER